MKQEMVNVFGLRFFIRTEKERNSVAEMLGQNDGWTKGNYSGRKAGRQKWPVLLTENTMI